MASVLASVLASVADFAGDPAAASGFAPSADAFVDPSNDLSPASSATFVAARAASASLQPLPSARDSAT